MAVPTPTIAIDPEGIETDRDFGGAKVTLFNRGRHTFEEVTLALIAAIGTSYQQGLQIATIVHYTGSAAVYRGALKECEGVAAID